MNCSREVAPEAGAKGTTRTMDHRGDAHRNGLAREIRLGMSARQRYIPSKYFYDARGSELFEDICRLPEYYPTRTEISILRDVAGELARPLRDMDIVELGSGAERKICLLLEAVEQAHRATLRYIPVDISESAIRESSLRLVEKYPEMEVLGIIADFTGRLTMLPSDRPRMFCFLGGTIGNLEESESVSFLRNLSSAMNQEDVLLVGFDMVKPTHILEAAYNDDRGVTAEFNRNILRVINRKLDADFPVSHFDHVAFFNQRRSRIEMHLRANQECLVRIRSIDVEVRFNKGDSIHTENSRKFTRQGIEHMVDQADLSIESYHTDPKGWFSLVMMRPEGRAGGRVGGGT